MVVVGSFSMFDVLFGDRRLVCPHFFRIMFFPSFGRTGGAILLYIDSSSPSEKGGFLLCLLLLVFFTTHSRSSLHTIASFFYLLSLAGVRRERWSSSLANVPRWHRWRCSLARSAPHGKQGISHVKRRKRDGGIVVRILGGKVGY